MPFIGHDVLASLLVMLRFGSRHNLFPCHKDFDAEQVIMSKQRFAKTRGKSELAK